jgi:hypothetical protein
MAHDLTELAKGQKVKIKESFLDFDHIQIETGSVWTFIRYSYFPYDGGYSFYFEEGEIRLAEIDDDNRRVLGSFSLFFEVLG